MTTHCAPACSQALPVKPQGVWARGIEACARSRDRRNLEFRRWGSLGPSSIMHFQKKIWWNAKLYINHHRNHCWHVDVGMAPRHLWPQMINVHLQIPGFGSTGQ